MKTFSSKEFIDKFSVRENTWDWNIFYNVFCLNEYHLPDNSNDFIGIDIGCHIGSFSCLALEKGFKKVYSFEPFIENYSLAKKNLSNYDKSRYQLENKAVWRSDLKTLPNLKFESPIDYNTGSGNVIMNQGSIEVESVSLDSIIENILDEGYGKINYLKLDCEGSEFPILLTSKHLDKIDNIVGEFHEIGGNFDSHLVPNHLNYLAQKFNSSNFTIGLLVNHLSEFDFSIKVYRHKKSSLGYFYATRKKEV